MWSDAGTLRAAGASRCECGAANCSGWLGGNRQQRLDVFALADSDEDGVENGLYEADGYGGVTKVQQLGAGGAAALPPDLAVRRQPALCFTTI